MPISQQIYVTVDAVVFAKLKKSSYLLLIKRENKPFEDSWALPGGFIDTDEPVKQACQRELKEETGMSLDLNQLKFFNFYDEVNRDPRSRTITFEYLAQLNSLNEVKGDDDATEAKWFDIKKLPKLAFDHLEIIKDALTTT
jgi:8-oxo-dGTP diphosphatase